MTVRVFTLLVAALSVGALARRADAVRGDADCNGQIGVADVPAAVASVFEHTGCADADVNGDGVPNASDVPALLQLLFGRSTRSAIDQVLDELQPDGTITLDTARRVFQIAYGGLDDVQVPTNDADAPTDGTLALAALLQHQYELSDADAARLGDVLDVNGPVSTTIQRGATPATALPHRPARRLTSAADMTGPLSSHDAQVDEITTRIEFWLPKLEAYAGMPLAAMSDPTHLLPIDVAVYDYFNPAAVADTLTFDADGGGGEPATCRIRFFKGTFTSKKTGLDVPADERDNTVVHELWHCFEAVIVGDRDKAFHEAAWLVEGQAEYVAAYLTNTESGYFAAYLAVPGRPLFARHYNAIGFYVTLESNAAPMAATLTAMLTSGADSSQAAFDAAGAAAPRLLQTWGELEFEVASRAGDWNYTTHTGMPPPPSNDIPGVIHLDMVGGSSELMTAQAHSVLLWRVDLGTDFIHFQIPGGSFGGARLLDAADHLYDDLTDIWLCQHPDPKDCSCPEGSDGEAPQSQPVQSPMKVAASAGNAGVYGNATSISLDELCHMKQTNVDRFCTDARNLQMAVSQFTPDDLSPTNLQGELETDVHWLGLMAQDAPSDIAGAMTPLAAAFVTANTDFASVGYSVVPMSVEDETTIQAALAAVSAVAPQSEQVGAYVLRVCHFAFHFPGV